MLDMIIDPEAVPRLAPRKIESTFSMAHLGDEELTKVVSSLVERSVRPEP